MNLKTDREMQKQNPYISTELLIYKDFECHEKTHAPATAIYNIAKAKEFNTKTNYSIEFT